MSGARRRALPGGAAGKAARYVAPAVFLLAVTVIVLLVRSSLRSDKPAAHMTSAAVTTRAVTTPPLPRPATPKQYYLIASGDTLDALAARFGTTVDKLLLLNPGIEPTTLRPGEQVRVR
jgi:LysM repeat protein